MSGRRFKFDIRQAGRYISVVLVLLAVTNGVFYFLATRPRVREYTSLREGTGPQQEALMAHRAEVEEREAYHEALVRAEADALLGFLMMCPKQLTWVKNPTQTCHTEQQHYLQYSNYCYTNSKIACLHRLARRTGRRLYGDLAERVTQSGFWSQEIEGPWSGAVYERMSDPWQSVSKDVNSKGTRYMSELAVDLHLQLIELGLARLHSES